MDTASCPKLLNESTLDKEELAKVTQQLISGNGQVKIADVVTALGPLLTHKDNHRRLTGLEFLTQCLGRIAEDKADLLDATEIHFLVTFLVDRLRDAPQMVGPALRGFSALAGMPGLRDPDFHAVLRALLLGEIHCQSLTVRDRARILELVEASLLSGDRLGPLRDSVDLSGQFVHGFLQCAEGETNPGNLSVLFRCWPVLLEHFDCAIFLEDIFEVLSCYFPIDFNQPKNSNPYSVTKDELKQGLHNR